MPEEELQMVESIVMYVELSSLVATVLDSSPSVCD